MQSFSRTGVVIKTFPDSESLSRAAAELFIERAEAAIKVRGRFSVALAGGKTPERTYELLAASPLRARVAWSAVHIFWGDERCVPREDPKNNSFMAKKALLDHVDIPPSQVHPILCASSPEAGARNYEKELFAFFDKGPPRFDLVLLGMGENGHTASLFPGSDALFEKTRWSAEVYVPEQALYRVTLTALLINQAETVAFLISGSSKAKTLDEVLNGPFDPKRLPAQLIEPQKSGGKLYWLIDREAASLLK